MKAIINGKRYNTEKATALADFANTNDRRDFNYYEETLYQTLRSKAYFLAGRGNARSKYAENLSGGSWGAGSKITPLTGEEAFAWAQAYLSADTVEIIFADLIEDA